MSKNKLNYMPQVNMRAYMGLPSVKSTTSALDFVYSKIYGKNNYERPWDEAEATNVTNEKLENDMIYLDQKYNNRSMF